MIADPIVTVPVKVPVARRTSSPGPAALTAACTVMALAWLLKHPSGIVPVVGSANPDNIRNAARATEIDLDRDTWYRILLAARGEKLP